MKTDYYRKIATVFLMLSLIFIVGWRNPFSWDTLERWLNTARTFTATQTFTTVDINGGAIDGTTIGASSATTGVFTTVNTGQGANELYDMDQNVLEASNVKFATIRSSGTTVSGDFPDFDAAESQVLNLTGLPGNNCETKLIRIYPADGDDPGGDFNVNCRLSFYNSDSMTEDELIKDFYFNLTYTEIKTATWALGATGGDLDSSAGLVAYDWIRLMGGTAESVNLASVTDSDTIVVTATAGAHVVDEGIGREVRITDNVDLNDADSTTEIHAKLEMLSDPGNAVGITMAITIQ